MEITKLAGLKCALHFLLLNSFLNFSPDKNSTNTNEIG